MIHSRKGGRGSRTRLRILSQKTALLVWCFCLVCLLLFWVANVLQPTPPASPDPANPTRAAAVPVSTTAFARDKATDRTRPHERISPHKAPLPRQERHPWPRQAWPETPAPHPPAEGYRESLRGVVEARRGQGVCAGAKCTDDERRDRVVQMMSEAWVSYKAFAWGADELMPISRAANLNPKNRQFEIWGGVSITLVDALDTLWIMGLHDEFREAVQYVDTSLDLERDFFVSTFETTIRLLGGLLSAYALSREQVLLDKAVLVGTKLLPAFKTSSGLPSQLVNLKTGERSYDTHKEHIYLADAGSLQLELRYLSEVSGNPAFAAAGDKALAQLRSVLPGLVPDHIDLRTLEAIQPTTVGVGAFSDSFYETLLKLWIQSGRQDTELRTAYDTAVTSIIQFLTGTSLSGATFVSNYHKGKREQEMQHLACFLPGMLALGVESSLDPNGHEEVLFAAERIAATCYSFYKSQPTGLSGDVIAFNTECLERECEDFVNSNNQFRLRPETIESLFVLSRVTQSDMYKDWAWEIFQSIERHCLVEHEVENTTMRAYGCYTDVTKVGAPLEDRTESFFYAELLKYFYLHFDNKAATVLFKDFVFTTEAHPLPRGESEDRKDPLLFAK